MVPSVVLTGLSFTDYAFGVADPDGSWNAVPGLYAFCIPGIGVLSPLTPVYIGETSSFAERMPWHPEWPAALRLGASLMLAMAFPGTERQRKDAECDLILAYRPRLNVQHNTRNALADLLGPRAKRF